MRFDLGERHRRGREDAALRGTAGDFGHRQERLASERGGGIEARAAAVRQQERASAGAAALSNALRKGEGDESAEAELPGLLRGSAGCRLGPAPGHGARLARARRTIAAEGGKSVA